MHSFDCPVCPEHFFFSVQEGIEATKEVFLRVVHNHEEDPPQWIAVIHEKGARGVDGKDEVMRVTRTQSKARVQKTQKKLRDAGDEAKKRLR